MAEEILSFAVQKLWEILSQEYHQFQGAKDQVSDLQTDLKTLKSFFKDADAKKHTREVVKTCIEEIKEIIFDAEDIIETIILKEELRKNGGIQKHMRRFSCIVPERRESASEIESLSKRISKVICKMKDFGVVQQSIADVKDSQSLQQRKREMRQEFPTEYNNDLVGMESNVNKLVGYLVEEDDVQVVSMTGMGGLGKTTLARQAFNHDKVKNKFDRLAWVCVSQVCDRMNVWQTILQNLRPKEEEKQIMQMKEARLHDELIRLFETSISLIVFDDIWKEEDWDLIKPIFPAKKGWKVLLTSRNENVARCGDKTYINFKPECLTMKDNWALFKRIAILRKDASERKKVDEEMEDMGRKMIEHWGGLPLAVRVLGGMLAAKYTVHYWKRVSENFGSHLLGRTNLNDDNNNSFDSVLSLSFEELPGYLKYCFLYLAHFPEDYEINVEDLANYWVAEGILRYNDGETIRDVGDNYVEELVRRNMVISERDNTTSRYTKCCLHDLMREICLSKAKEDNFLQIVSSSTHSQSLSTSRRFVTHYPTTLDAEREINNPKVLSLMVVLKGIYWNFSSLSFTGLQLLRVLHLPLAIFKGRKLPYSIGKLIHLRYLNLQHAEYTKEDQAGIEPSSKLGDLKEFLNGVFGAKGTKGWSTLLEFSNLNHLKLTINIPLFSEELQFPSCLTSLNLWECFLEEDPMPILEKLGHLKEVELHWNSFCGSRMVCSGGGFPQLQKLEFFRLEEWEEWIIEEGSMPILYTLHIINCEKLKKVPDGLPFITSLKDLRCIDMGEQWKERLSAGGEDYHKVQHISFLQFVY
ncbi:hypothetical protein N665_0405s0004 [Sinapis alba]|nr:hypothetical protein N665_0405s0004 [Sinapis alba]